MTSEVEASFVDSFKPILDTVSWLAVTVPVVLSVGFILSYIWKNRHRKTAIELLLDIASEVNRRFLKLLKIEGDSRITREFNSVNRKIERKISDLLFDNALDILKTAKVEGGNSLLLKTRKAIRIAASAAPIISQFSSLSRSPGTLSRIHLQTLRTKLNDSESFTRIQSLINETIYKELLDDAAFMKLVTSFNISGENHGYTIDVDIAPHTHTREDLLIDGAANLAYYQRSDDLVGRKDLINHLVSEFLNIDSDPQDERHFRWTLLHGRAGSGKSRFAVELLRDKRVEEHFTILGFVGDDRNTPSRPLCALNAQRWQSNGPAFFVLDYASQVKDLAKIILSFERQSQASNQKIRLLLLERINEVWTERLTSNGGSGLPLRKSRYEVSGDKNGKLGHELRTSLEENEKHIGAITIEQLLQITKRRIQVDRPLAAIETDEFLIREIYAVDPEHRPLFAAVVGRQLGVAPPISIEDAESEEKRKQRSEEIIADFIDRERKRFWLEDGEEREDQIPRQHEFLLALSTMCRGVPRRILSKPNPEGNFYLPSEDNFEHQRYRRMISTPNVGSNSNEQLGFLVPDFIGEWFVLETLDNQLSIEARRRFVDFAWESSASGAMQFIRHCHQNHHQRISDLKYLLPESRIHRTEVLNLLCRLIDEISIFATRAWQEGNQASEEIERIIKHLINLIDTLKLHCQYSEKLEESDKSQLAEAVSRFSFAISFLMSSSLRDAESSISLSKAVKVDEHQKDSDHRFYRTFSLIPKQSITATFRARAADEAVDEVNQGLLDMASPYVASEAVRDAQKRENSHAELAGKLLSDAATFFDTLARENPPIAVQMSENAEVYRQIGVLVGKKPTDLIEDGGAAHFELADKLLRDAADFFLTLGEQNSLLAGQMSENAYVFKQLADLLSENPTGYLIEEPSKEGEPTKINKAVDRQKGAELSSEFLLEAISDALCWVEEIIEVEAPPSSHCLESVSYDASIFIINAWRYAIEFANDEKFYGWAKRKAFRILKKLDHLGPNSHNVTISLATLAVRFSRHLSMRCRPNNVQGLGRNETKKNSYLLIEMASCASKISDHWADKLLSVKNTTNATSVLEAWAKCKGMSAYALGGTNDGKVLEILRAFQKKCEGYSNIYEIQFQATFAINGLLNHSALLKDKNDINVGGQGILKELKDCLETMYKVSNLPEDHYMLVGGLGVISELSLATEGKWTSQGLMLIQNTFSRWGENCFKHQNAAWATYKAGEALLRATHDKDITSIKLAYKIIAEIFGSEVMTAKMLRGFIMSIAYGKDTFDKREIDVWKLISRRCQNAITEVCQDDDSGEKAAELASLSHVTSERWGEEGVRVLWDIMIPTDRNTRLAWLFGINKRSSGNLLSSKPEAHLKASIKFLDETDTHDHDIDLKVWVDVVSSFFFEAICCSDIEHVDSMLEELRIQSTVPKEAWFQAVSIVCLGIRYSSPELLFSWVDIFLSYDVEDFKTDSAAYTYSFTASTLAYECLILDPIRADNLIGKVDMLLDQIHNSKKEDL